MLPRMDISSVPHAFLVSFPGQGHINPLLRLGKLLASKGLLVTLSAPETFGQRLRKTNHISDQPTRFGDGMIRFEFFDDEYKLEKDKAFDMDLYMDRLQAVGKKILPQLIKTNEEQGRPVSCLIYNSFIPWVSDVAHILHIPCAALWVQSCASFSAYYHYHHSLVPFPTESHPEVDVPLPSMPLLRYDEVPSFLLPETPYPFLRRAILGQFKHLSHNSCILMDTFQELENDVIQYMANFCPIKPIGPLFKFPHYNAPSSDIVSADMIKADDCTEWLDSKPPFSVVYISFGSVVNLKQEQATEIAHGLMNSGLPFLWVLRPPYEEIPTEPIVLPDDFWVKVGDKGKVVQWSHQQRVLTHPSVACFMTHCGWNSTLEALANGVPVLAFPQWGDQVTNAKYLVDEFKVGIRMCRGEAENRIVPREEITKCLLEETTGPKATDLRESAAKWKKRAEDAVADGGSSNRNIQEFLNYLSGR